MSADKMPLFTVSVNGVKIECQYSYSVCVGLNLIIMHPLALVCEVRWDLNFVPDHT